MKKIYYKFFVIYKSEWEYWFNLSKNWDVILTIAKDYYGNDKERLREQAKNTCRNLSEK